MTSSFFEELLEQGGCYFLCEALQGRSATAKPPSGCLIEAIVLRGLENEFPIFGDQALSSANNQDPQSLSASPDVILGQPTIYPCGYGAISIFWDPVVKALLIFAILAAVIVGGYHYERIWDLFDTSPESFPVTRILKDSEGRSVEADILGISYDKVTFRRKTDGRLFRFPIARLSQSDRIFLSRFPTSSDPISQEKSVDATSLHIQNMRIKIQKLEREIAILEQKTQDPTGYHDGRKVEIFEEQIDEIESKINHLRVKIMELEQ